MKGFLMKPKSRKRKREGPLRIPLPFEEVISDVLKVKPERRPSSKSAKRSREGKERQVSEV
jgi:hypothetical protein